MGNLTNELVEKCTRNGSMERVNRLLSAIHILMSEASDLMQESSDVLALNGLRHGTIAKKFNKAMEAQDDYFREFTKIIKTEKDGNDLFKDIEDFDKEFRKWAVIERGWFPFVVSSKKP